MFIGERAVNQRQRSLWIFFTAGIFFAASLIAVVRYVPLTHGLTFWFVALALLIVGAGIASLPYAGMALFFEMTTIVLAWFVFKGDGYENSLFCYLPLIAAVLVSVTYPVMPRSSPVVVTALTAAWFILAGGALKMFTAAQWFFIAATALMLLVFAVSIVLRPRHVPRQIDVLLCSYSSNTAHFTGLFTDAAMKAGANVFIHRFHHYRGFTASYEGDALVVAFPVIGWKPPWPMLYYLLLKLPRGGGKPACILYTAGGGPENAGMLVWFVLTLKGYRVAGRNWGIYPINVPTVRLGTAAFWRWMDSLTPCKGDDFGAADTGRGFAEGNPAGLPFIFWPFFLWVAGVIVDNPIINRIYRNHTFRKRCNGCGICIRYCPAQRLRMVNGYPQAEGTCTICLGCVNICPTKAMQMWFFTEYGRPYPPRWPSLVVKGNARDESR